MLGIGAIHAFRLGTYLSGVLFTLYYSFFSDIIIPFGMYFLLCLNDFNLKFLRGWLVKSLLVFGITSFTEILQAFGVPLLGQIFDPLDFVMFGIGTLLAVLMERVFLTRVFPFWSLR